ncbi:unnamed protein product [Arctia plantaginis]|uniref:Uncharacterized protein n=1 Tax=Arctia plantaginis TaxID=874455 RepID=A0A8S0Z7L9_ARCPL|nr:unnamed protein product [Arctia plantaginis]CAB3228271.1 unnamed protein product [Arctia plantaginis]
MTHWCVALIYNFGLHKNNKMNKNLTVNSCLSLDLRTGSFICGYLNLAWHLAIAIVYLWVMIAASSIPFDVTSALVIIGIDLGFIGINVIFNVMLIIGLHTLKRGFINAFIIYNYIFLAFCLIMFIIYLSLGGGVLNIMFKLVSLCFTAIFLLIIRSYYLSMDDNKTGAAMY